MNAGRLLIDDPRGSSNSPPHRPAIPRNLSSQDVPRLQIGGGGLSTMGRPSTASGVMVPGGVSPRNPSPTPGHLTPRAFPPSDGISPRQLMVPQPGHTLTVPGAGLRKSSSAGRLSPSSGEGSDSPGRLVRRPSATPRSRGSPMPSPTPSPLRGSASPAPKSPAGSSPPRGSPPPQMSRLIQSKAPSPPGSTLHPSPSRSNCSPPALQRPARPSMSSPTHSQSPPTSSRVTPTSPMSVPGNGSPRQQSPIHHPSPTGSPNPSSSPRRSTTSSFSQPRPMPSPRMTPPPTAGQTPRRPAPETTSQFPEFAMVVEGPTSPVVIPFVPSPSFTPPNSGFLVPSPSRSPPNQHSHHITLTPPEDEEFGFPRVDSVCIQKCDKLLRLSCPCCMVAFDEPHVSTRMLDCNHTFCQTCLEDICVNGTIVCPRCKQVTSVEFGGVESLRPNYALCGISGPLAGMDAAHMRRRGTDVFLDDIGATCPVCMESFSKGRLSAVLSCGHSLCQDCLNSLADQKTNSFFECPTCRVLTSKAHGCVNEPLEKALKTILAMRKEAAC